MFYFFFVVFPGCCLCVGACVCSFVCVSIGFSSTEQSVCLESLSCADVLLICLQGGYLVSRSDCFISVVCFVVLFACVLRLSRVYFLRCYFVSFVSVAVLFWFAISGRIHYAGLLKEAL